MNHKDQPSMHILTRASAGSGKTHQLTARYLNLLRRDVEPTTILATTFTRKAAGEILSRILHWLARAQLESGGLDALAKNLDNTTPKMAGPLAPVTADNARRWLDRLIANLHRLRVGTLDSFFGRISRAYPFELDLSPGVMLTDDRSQVIAQLRMEAITAMLDDLGNQREQITALLELLRSVHFDNARQSVTAALDELFLTMYELYRETPDVKYWQRLKVSPDVDPEALRAALEAMADGCSDLPLTKKKEPDSRFVKLIEQFTQAFTEKRWEDFCATGLAQLLLDTDPDQDILYYKKPLPQSIVQPARVLLQKGMHECLSLLDRQTRATHALLAQFDRHFTKAKQHRQLLCFNDLTVMLAEQVQRCDNMWLMDLYQRLDEQITHLLLDEFQDTSLLQWRILEPMADEILAHGDGSHSFFCVGDTKQSIYGWRGGLPRLFDMLEASPKLQVQHLDYSWRSSPVVLDAINILFGHLKDNPLWQLRECVHEPTGQAAAAWQDQFRNHTVAPPRQGDPLPGHVLIQTTRLTEDVDDSETDGADGQENSEAPTDDAQPTSADLFHLQRVAEHIANLHAHAPQASIGVLVRNRAWIARTVDALRALNVTASAEGTGSLTDSPAVTAVLAAMTLADHPQDSVAFFHVANSPMGAVLGLSATAQALEIGQIAATIRIELLEQGYAALVVRWIHALASQCSTGNLRRLEQLGELARQYDAMGAAPQRPGAFADFVRSAAMADTQHAGIRVMTIHAAKGLEFDAVVLPQLHAKFQSQFSAMASLADKQADGQSSVQAVFRMPKESLRNLSPQLQQAWDARQMEMRREWLCLLYVAMTRARQGLYIYLPPRRWNKKGVGKIPDSHASLVREGLKAPDMDEASLGPDACDVVLFEAGSPDWYDAAAAEDQTPPPMAQADGRASDGLDILRHRKAPTHPWRALERSAPSRMTQSTQLHAGDVLRHDHASARLRGTVMHAWCELVGFVDQTDGVPADAELIAMARRLAPQVDLAEIEKWIAVFRQSLAAPTVHAMLACQQASDLWRERKLQCVEDGRLISAVLDRVALWRDAQGRCERALLIDFKTDRENDPQVLINHYQPQLQIYRRLLARATGLPPQQIQTVLVSLQHAWVIEVPEAQQQNCE